MTTATVDSLQAVLLERFAQGRDGYWYPNQPGIPLVRILVRDRAGLYQVERRRSPQTAWVQLLEGLTGDFDASSFVTWVETFEQTRR